MEFMETVYARRSVRRFASRPVPEAALADILEAARHAPAPGGVNSCYFGIIQRESTRRALAAVSGGQDWVATAPVVLALCSKLGADPALRPADDLGLTVNVDRFGQPLIDYLNAYPDRKAIRVYWDNANPLIPGEHAALAAASHGLGACFIGHLDTARASEILGLPDDMVCLFLLPIGYPDETPADKVLRPMAECVFTDHWNDGATDRG